jgi:hypothetical protein
MSNFWKGAIPAFQKGYQLSSENYLKSQQLDQIAKQREEIAQQKADEQNLKNFYLQELLAGKTQSPELNQSGFGAEKTQLPITLGNVSNQYTPIEPKLTQSMQERPISLPEKINALIGTGASFPQMERYLNPPQAKVSYKDLKFDQPGAVYGLNTSTNAYEPVPVEGKIQNPFYAAKVKATSTGYNPNGEKIIKRFFTDGSVEEIPTGFMKKNDPKGGDSFDPAKYNKVLDHYTNEVNSLTMLKAKMVTEQDPAFKRADAIKINALAFNNEQALTDLMVPEGKKQINAFYDELKKQNKDYQTIIDKKPQEAKRLFDSQLAQKYNDGKIDKETYRSLALWAKFKFGYVGY